MDTQHDIRRIVEKAKARDDQAFSVLYTTYFSPIYRYVYFRIGDEDETEDVVQDVFVKAFASMSNYTHSKTPFLAYLYTIARNATIDFYRKKKSIILDDEQLVSIPDQSDGPHAQALQNETVRHLHQKIMELPAEQEEVVTLRFINGYTTLEIATMLDKTTDAVRQLQSRGLRYIKNNFL